jgi:xanthine dehydrogenase accessory factor
VDCPRVFGFLAGKLDRGLRCVLVTVVAVEGSSMRDPGTHMGVCQDGSFCGSLSGGCIEAAVVAEALAALADGAPRIVRFGTGSPYLDIRLPCGGGLDIHFQPLADAGLVAAGLAAVEARQPFTVAITPAGAAFAQGWMPPRFDFAGGYGAFGHWPQARLVLVGHGAGLAALARLARTMELAVEALSPDAGLVAALEREGLRAARLARSTDTAMLRGDRWTAFAFLFHDHDWEIALLRQALALPHFYVGAMGGRRAHALRRAALAQAGVAKPQVASIHAPIGLFHSSRDPGTLALSALGEIVKAYQDSSFETGLG